MASVLAFVRAVWDHATGWIFGAFASASSIAYGFVASKVVGHEVNGPPLWISIAGIVVFLFVAFYKAWRDENRKLEEARLQLEKLSKPNFRFEPNGVNVVANRDGQVGLVIEAAIVNTGAPSICTGYDLVVRHKNIEVQAEKLWIPRDGQIEFGFAGKRSITLTYADHLASKTIADPIPTNGQRLGFLLYGVPGITMDQLRRDKIFDCEITLIDAHGTRVKHPIPLGEDFDPPGTEGTFRTQTVGHVTQEKPRT